MFKALKNKLSPKARRIILLSIFAVVCLYSLNLIVRQQQQLQLQEQSFAQLNEQLAQLEATNAQLQRTLEFTASEAYLEQLAREQLGYVKDGEILFVEEETPDDGNDVSPSPSAPIDSGAATTAVQPSPSP